MAKQDMSVTGLREGSCAIGRSDVVGGHRRGYGYQQSIGGVTQFLSVNENEKQKQKTGQESASDVMILIFPPRVGTTFNQRLQDNRALAHAHR